MAVWCAIRRLLLRSPTDRVNQRPIGAATELFGVHPEHGLLRVDWCGVMMIGGRKAVGVEADRIPFGNLTGYRNVPGAPVGIPI